MYFKLLYVYLTIFLLSAQPTKIHFFSDKKALFAQKILFIFYHFYQQTNCLLDYTKSIILMFGNIRNYIFPHHDTALHRIGM